MRVDFDAAFSTAVRNVADGVLDCHPCSKGFDFVFIGLRMETDAAFCCAACGGVLYAVAGEYFYMAVIHGDRDADCQLAFRITDEFIIISRAAEYFCCLIQYMKHIFIRIVTCHDQASKKKWDTNSNKWTLYPETYGFTIPPFFLFEKIIVYINEYSA